MNSNSFGKYFLYQLVIFFLLKLWFFNNVIFSNQGVQQLVFWAIIAAVAAALVRRFGAINFLESFFVIFIWVVGGLIVDLLITSRFTGNVIFASMGYWLGFLFLGISVFLFHKKRHLKVRHDMHAKSHAHSHAPAAAHGHDPHKH